MCLETRGDGEMSNSFLNGVKTMQNFTTTENGAVAHKTTGSNVLNLFAQIGALRNVTPEERFERFLTAYHEDKLLAMKVLFYGRDVRGGLGERDTFNHIMTGLSGYDPKVVMKNIHLIAEYGRWDDVISLALSDSAVSNEAVELIKTQLQKDWTTENPSLLAKWMPSENSGVTKSKVLKRLRIKLEKTPTYSIEYRQIQDKILAVSKQNSVESTSNKEAKKMMTLLGMQAPYYRKVISTLRRKISLVETKMSSNDWGSIPYANIPSKAGLLYRKAFLRHDEVRYTDFLESLNNGGNVNSKTLYPYELINKIMDNTGDFKYGQEEYYPLYNAMWEQMADFTSEDFGDSIAVVDTSDSMTWEQNSTALKVALSMGLYFAENNKSLFKNHIMSFSTQPQLVQINGEKFVDKVQNMLRQTARLTGGSTNIEKVFELILSVAEKNKLPQSELPKRIVIISDMEFDRASNTTSFRASNPNRGSLFHSYRKDQKTLMQQIKVMFTMSGYTMPKLVFWNVNAKNEQFPIEMSDNGVQLVSGYSTNVLKALVSGKEELSAYDLMLDTLSDERYNEVTV